jgi:hypothetical protein
MRFLVPPADSSAFFPISIKFAASISYSDVKVCINLKKKKYRLPVPVIFFSWAFALEIEKLENLITSK